jgi:Zinc finger C-x8-C-x5-C-x3-H type (and similar)
MESTSSMLGPFQTWPTKICPEWRNGECKDGNSCPLPHPNKSSWSQRTAELPGSWRDRNVENTTSTPNVAGPCTFFFRNGRCRFAERCQNSHDPESLSNSHDCQAQRDSRHQFNDGTPTSTSYAKERCKFFFRNHWCKFAEKCRYSHDPESLSNLHDSQVQSDSRGGYYPSKFRDPATASNPYENLQLVLRRFKHQPNRDFPTMLLQFNEHVHEIFDRNDSRLQSKVAVLLSEEMGLNFVRSVAQKVGEPLHQKMDFDQHLIPFMKIIIHDVLSRTCVEKNFILLLNIIYGPDGERGARFLSTAVGMLQRKFEQFCGDENDVRVKEDYCLTTSFLFLSIVRHNKDARAHDELRELHLQLTGIFQSAFDKRTPVVGQIARVLSQILPYVKLPTIATTELDADECLATPIVRENYDVLARNPDLPGTLSRIHPRHDNDFGAISKIRILPTKEEIQSDEPPYLPINDVRAPHFLEGPQRLFDIHFRLLREDMVGSMRSAISRLLPMLKPKVAMSHALRQFDTHGAFIRLYYDVTVMQSTFDQRRGLIFRVRFQQPPKLRHQSKEKRSTYWKARRLEKDSLLCLVSNVPALECFVTVAKKDEGLLVDDRAGCAIDIMAADGAEATNAFLLRAMMQYEGPKMELVIVEFPGILLEGYKSNLHCMQWRSLHPFLPFSNILCPLRKELLPYDVKKKVFQILPPLYTASEGFFYDLESLKNRSASDTPLLLFPNASPDDEALIQRLEHETTLDAGQCKGLVLGLTHELAVIQGLYQQ